jgi:hypothetical protein
MTVKEIKSRIASLEQSLVADHYDHDLHTFVPAEGHTRVMILANIKHLKTKLPSARHDDLVNRYGWKSVERNV